MQKHIVLMILILCVVSTLMAVPYERTEEYRQKQAILNERATKFKAETGFTGSITYNHQYMRFSQISGSFKGIDVTAFQDSVHMREIFTQVLAKVSPYIASRQDQLVRAKVVSNEFGTSTIYRQLVNGYKVEGGIGFLKMSFNSSTRKMTIIDDTASIRSDVVPINLSLNEALELVRVKIYNGNEQTPYNPRIAYTLVDVNGGHEFFLCYILDFWDYTVCVDVSDSSIRRLTPAKILRSFNVNVLGEEHYDKSTETTQNNSDE